MSRESKLFTAPNKKVIGDRVKEYESFGWELLSINGLDVSLSRETQNSVYTELVKYEYQYDVLREKVDNLQKPSQPAAFSLVLFLVATLILIVPGVLYVYFYLKKKNEYIEQVRVYEETYANLLIEIKKVCDDSRAVFFSRQK